MLTAVFLLLIATVIVVITWRALRGVSGFSLVQPILLDDALDNDLRELRYAVRADTDLLPQRRKALFRLIVRIAADRQQRLETGDDERARLQAAWDELTSKVEHRG